MSLIGALQQLLPGRGKAMMEAAMKHRALYKGTTPPWKETYRKRCVERLKSNRAQLLERLRQVGDRVSVGAPFLVQDVMEEEWQAMRSQPSLWPKESQDPDELVTLEEIKQELLLKEQAMVEEIESISEFESACLDSVVGLSRNEVVCPVCNRNYLKITSCFVMCQCGVYINCKSQGMNTEKLQALLEANVLAHASCCSAQPVFSAGFGAEGLPSMFMSCCVCDAVTIII
ncbi:LOW QUALITY PROTEIN: RPA-interacting protein [Dendrobates tinctorius]|uniref:LOW QUALITY PROTEIN: RPA-interacting protein n=1 Tax=Dendrobates tinctorius TaxID=92724 RepID=UPI003CC95D98